jgi:hypothetical protein
MEILVLPFGMGITVPRFAFEESYSRFIGLIEWPIEPAIPSTSANQFDLAYTHNKKGLELVSIGGDECRA